jgi:hypothetical protein
MARRLEPLARSFGNLAHGKGEVANVEEVSMSAPVVVAHGAGIGSFTGYCFLSAAMMRSSRVLRIFFCFA